jgi:hypothetical protein
MLFQFVHQLVGKLSVRRRHDMFLYKFAIHHNVLPASKTSAAIVPTTL